MSTTLYLLITAVLLTSGAVMALLTRLSQSPFGAAHPIRQGKNHGLSPEKFRRTALGNSILSVVLIYGMTFLLEARMFHEGATGLPRILVEGVVILALFDFFYYLLHRYPFHEWTLLRKVHAVHHIVRNPTAIDSLYQHPVENALGLVLLWACVLAVALVAGPVNAWSFGWAFLVYSLLNVVVHDGLDLRARPLRVVTYLATRHNKHHVSMAGKNYASVTPLWDRVFGTEEP